MKLFLNVFFCENIIICILNSAWKIWIFFSQSQIICSFKWHVNRLYVKNTSIVTISSN